LASNAAFGAIATNRFGLGARPGELRTAAMDPHGWLKAQIRRVDEEGSSSPGATGADRYRQFLTAMIRKRESGRLLPQAPLVPQDCAGLTTRGADQVAPAPPLTVDRLLKRDAGRDHRARLRRAISTPTPFHERWTRFFANHFTVAGSKISTINLVAPFEAEAIRPNVFGTFEVLLQAAIQHPAMLLYLDQAPSVGPNSDDARRAALKGRHVALNENLARELLELHTVGLDAGYSQEDIAELAAALTGWDVAGRGARTHKALGLAAADPTQARVGAFVFGTLRTSRALGAS
jgi:uncharacterized protein (DUF1800 family)